MDNKPQPHTPAGGEAVTPAARRLAAATNLALVAADIIEGSFIEWQAAMRDAGMRCPRPLANAARSVLLGAAALRKAGLDRDGDDLSDAFADTADKAWALVLMVIDRFGTTEADLFKAWCWLKAHPSKGQVPMPAWLDGCFATWEGMAREQGGDRESGDSMGAVTA